MYNLMCKYEMEMSLKICDYNWITVQNVLEAVSMLKGVKSSLFIIPPPTHTQFQYDWLNMHKQI